MTYDPMWDELDNSEYGTKYYDRTGKQITMRQWGALRYENYAGIHPPYMRIAATRLGDIWISTTWLGLDHRMWGEGPPLIFETMVFGGPDDQEMERYSTEAAALAGHDRWVAREREHKRR